MPYAAMPAVFVSVESGHIKGPATQKGHTLVETISIPEIASCSDSSEAEDTSRNVVVLSLENLVEKSEGRKSIQQYALKFKECRQLCHDLLIHLACAGDTVARYLLCQLGPGQDQEDSGEDSEG
jgi:hypothetical protein